MKTSLALLCALVATATAARADVILSHQGRLFGANDEPVNETKPVTFRLYSKSDGGTGDIVWSETYDVRFLNGAYGVLLGDTKSGKAPIALEKVQGDRWLAIVVENVELLPRLQLGTVPSAANAAALGGIEAAKYALKTDTAPNALQLGGKDAGLFALKTDTAADSIKLGGKDASAYALRDEVSTNALQLGGKDAEAYALKTDTAPNALQLGGKDAGLFALKTDTALDSAKLGGFAATSLLDSNGKILAGALPASVAQLTSGKLAASAIPSVTQSMLSGTVAPLAPVFVEAEAPANVGGSGTVSTDATASGGSRILASASGAANRQWGVQNAQLASLGGSRWGTQSTLVTARIKVANNTSTAALANFNCTAYRGATPAWVAAGTAVNIVPSTLAANTWTTIQLSCDWRPDDADTFVGFDGFVTGVTDLSIDWVSAVPYQRRPARSCREALELGLSRGDGVYTIQPTASLAPVNVYCDMTTSGGGWTLIASTSGTNTDMPKFSTTASTPCTSASPTSPCFVGAAAFNAIPYVQAVWSNTANATPTFAPIAGHTEGVPDTNAICVNDTEYFRFNQNSAAEGMAWNGCVITDYYTSGGYNCPAVIGPSLNLVSCNGTGTNTTGRSSPDYNCSPFGKYNSTCAGFNAVRHWRR